MKEPIPNSIPSMEESENTFCGSCFRDNEGKQKPEELIHKRMNDINTFQAHENEVYLRGTDEWGKDFQICFDSYNFLEWIDTEQLIYIKQQLVKYINKK